jgi:hypothetical protein
MRYDVWFARTTARPFPLPGCRPESQNSSVVHHEPSGFAATPLHEYSAPADLLGIGRVLAKDESQCLHRASFKIPGACWAIVDAIRASRLGHDPRPLTLSAAPERVAGSRRALIATTATGTVR